MADLPHQSSGTPDSVFSIEKARNLMSSANLGPFLVYIESRYPRNVQNDPKFSRQITLSLLNMLESFVKTHIYDGNNLNCEFIPTIIEFLINKSESDETLHPEVLDRSSALVPLIGHFDALKAVGIAKTISTDRNVKRYDSCLSDTFAKVCDIQSPAGARCIWFIAAPDPQVSRSKVRILETEYPNIFINKNESHSVFTDQDAITWEQEAMHSKDADEKMRLLKVNYYRQLANISVIVYKVSKGHLSLAQGAEKIATELELDIDSAAIVTLPPLQAPKAFGSGPR